MKKCCLRKTFEKWKARVEEAAGGKEALRKISEKEYDLILLDSLMPDLGGFDLVGQLKENHCGKMPLIMMLTSGHRVGDIKRAKELGVGAYVIKPIKREELEVVIRKIFASQANGNLLIVDDDLEILETLQDFLAPLGINIYIAQSVEEAEGLLDCKVVDTVLSDLHMKGRSGLDFLKQLRAEDKRVPFILLSAHLDEKVIAAAKELNVSQIVEKPCDTEKLSDIVKKSIEQGLRQRTLLLEERKRNEMKPLKILIADDSEDNRNLLEVYLKDEKHSVEFAENGQEAVSKAEDSDYDLIFMDMQMPIMDGYEATKGVRELEKRKSKNPVPIVALTANAMDEEKKKAFDVGCSDYLTKPIRKNTLFRAIRENATKMAS